ncbi:hypothetical protein ADEAN_000146000 [Angomonas deanei]|uniref:Uncharacterized protein n=1 Tax=Angomonas deanei TaxID=59799 RepID=A0A7G2C2X3_9TRYP|nr:hypothetical protein ADEAN_000146000 [Angomonas deanei]
MLRRSWKVLSKPQGPLLGLQVIFTDKTLPIGSDALVRAVGDYEKSFKNVDLRVANSVADGFAGALSFSINDGKPQRIDVIARPNCPLPPSITDRCITYAMYNEKAKEAMVKAQSTVYLNYVQDGSIHPLEAYSSLCCVGGALVNQWNAVGVLNVNAHNSAPAFLFSNTFIQSKQPNGSAMDFFRTLPLTTLYCGFVRYSLPTTTDKLGFRSYGATLLGLPDFCAYAEQELSDVVFSTFNSFWEFGISKGQSFEEGQVIQLTSNAQTSIALRTLKQDEGQPTPQGKIFVLEPVHGWQAFRPSTDKPK